MVPGNKTAFWYSKNNATEALHLNSVLFEFLILELLKLLNFPDSVPSTGILERHYGPVHVKAHNSVPGTCTADRTGVLPLFSWLYISLLGKTMQNMKKKLLRSRLKYRL